MMAQTLKSLKGNSRIVATALAKAGIDLVIASAMAARSSGGLLTTLGWQLA